MSEYVIIFYKIINQIYFKIILVMKITMVYNLSVNNGYSIY